ncbi:MAG TPA: folylpolyglutamate synthase/dihydrofolate synthase family protein [Vicinamibacterales bacterium]
MTNDPLQWLFSLERLGMKFGLENMIKLSAELGDPHQRFPSVHIAGTNGKGSVTAMIDAGLRAAGFFSARYTSPHLVRVEERFVIGGEECDTAALKGAVERVRGAVDALLARGELDAPATFFECTTAAAFELFASAHVDIAVLEVGLGGRLDATNIVTPLATAITTIDFDHQAQLGTTIEEIAAEKAGIIKPGVPVVIGGLPAAAEAVVADTARHAGAPLVRALEQTPTFKSTHLGLQGAHQRDNAAVAAAVLAALGPRGFKVEADAIRRGLESVRWPGRLEHVRSGGTDVLLDAAHNPAGARALASYIREIGWTDATLVFAAMNDKDARGMLEQLAPVVRRIVCTTAPTMRAETADVLAGIAASAGGTGSVDAIDDPASALADAAAKSRRVVVAGSIFLIGPLRGILR